MEMPLTAPDVALLRSEFPALQASEAGLATAFFDGPGGTQVPRRVIDAVEAYYLTSNANSGGAFAASVRNDAMVVEARRAAADFLGAASPEEIKFGANMTTLTFHLSRSIGATLRPGDELLVTGLDHEANVSPWRAIADDRGLTIRTVSVRTGDCTLDLDDFEAKLSRRTRLVAFGWASNAVGTINPVAELVRRAHEAGALTWIDAVHYAPHGPIDVVALDTDFLVCSAYKFFGPHAGLLYGRQLALAQLPAYKVRPAHDRFETGTPNFEGIAGTMAAIEYLALIGERFGLADADGRAGQDRRTALVAGMTAIRRYEMDLYGRLHDGLASLPGVRIYGIAEPDRFEERTPTAALTVEGISAREAATALAKRGIATWDGDFYAQGLIERLGLAGQGGLLRIGIVHYNTTEEVDRLLEALGELGSPRPSLARARS
jgi:cysteine desulfurase family protein (TIGR01976 family)